MIKELLKTEQRTAIERWCRERARSAAMPDGTTLCRVLGEKMIIVTLDDLSVAPHLALDGYWEMWNTICLAKRIKPGWKCIDVGANFGYFTVLLAELTGAEVEAWEPADDLVELLKKTRALNGLRGRVKVVPMAASKDNDTLALQRAQHDYRSAKVLDMGSPIRDEDLLQDAPADRLDTTDLDRVDFIKIDSEGFEPEVWEGMRRLIERGDPKAVLMEWAPKRYEAPREFLQQIARDGFRVHVVDGSGDLQKPVGDITEIDGHLDLWLDRP